MSHNNRDNYLVVALYGTYDLQDNKPIWDWSNWKRCYETLDEIAQAIIPATKGEIISSQVVQIPLKKPNQVTYKKFGVGRMGWSFDNHKKWTTLHQQKSLDGEWRHISTEINLPAMHKLATDQFPEFHIDITCDEHDPHLNVMPFHQSMVLLVEMSVAERVGMQHILKKINVISELMNAIYVIKTNSPWIHPTHNNTLLGAANQFLMYNDTVGFEGCRYGDMIEANPAIYEWDILLNTQV